ncbi:hypothetical protein Taro_052735, partial [Colocasia esculenta]|nr:hypothetical protein [Colocasia esculenta]
PRAKSLLFSTKSPVPPPSPGAKSQCPLSPPPLPLRFPRPSVLAAHPTPEPLATVEDPTTALLPLPLRGARKEDLWNGVDAKEVLRGARVVLLCSSRPCRATQKSPRSDNILKEASSLSGFCEESPVTIVSPMSFSMLLRSATPLLDRSLDGCPLSLGVAAYAVVPVKVEFLSAREMKGLDTMSFNDDDRRDVSVGVPRQGVVRLRPRGAAQGRARTLVRLCGARCLEALLSDKPQEVRIGGTRSARQAVPCSNRP